MGTPSAEHHEYDLLCRLLEEGRSWSPPPPPATATPSAPSPVPLSSPSPHGGAPCKTSEPRRHTPAWASAMRGFSNTMCLVMLVFLAPTAMQSTNKERVFIWVGIFLMSFAFPVLGYVFTWDQP